MLLGMLYVKSRCRASIQVAIISNIQTGKVGAECGKHNIFVVSV